MLHGRDVERARVAAVLAASRDGRAGCLVVQGEPGAGKSALVDDAVRSAGDMQLLRTVGLESEAPLAFAALHRLLRPVLRLHDRLPAPQARALDVAFGREEGSAIEPFLVALAALSLLTEAAETAPVLCVVDDAHWLDSASATALLFAARRLAADRVAMLFCARDADSASFPAQDLPTLRLLPLDAAAARSMLSERAGREVPPEVVSALLARTGGNPLGLAELPATLSAEHLTGEAPMPASVHLTATLERTFLDRARRLPQHVQTMLLLVAADDSGSVSVVRSAARALGVAPGAVDQAERSELLDTTGDSLRVRHPLVRSALYQGATGSQRRAAHRALADALAGSGDPDRLAWHRAAAAEGPDADAADALASAGQRAERRGGHAAAAAAYERAADLTATGPLRAARLYAAARAAWAAGRPAHARHLAERARPAAEDGLLVADIERLRGRIEVNVGSAARAYRIFLDAAVAVAGTDPVRALELSVAATLTHQFDSAAAGLPARRPVPVGRDGRGRSPRERCLHHLLAATTADAAGRMPDALAAHAAAMRASGDVDDPDVLANLGNAALHLGDEQAHRECFSRVLASARERGAVMQVLYALPRLALAQWAAGEWDRVRESADEALRLSADIGEHALGAVPLGWLTLLAAVRGSPEHEALDRRLRAARQQHLGVLTDLAHDLSRWAAGAAALSAGDAAPAVEQLRELRLPTVARLAAYDRFDAAVRAGDGRVARPWLDDLVAFADDTRWPWALATADHARGLLADPADGPGLLESALRHHVAAGRRHDAARTRLALGELLRRSQRRVDARAHLRAALSAFDALGAEPLSSRAARELRASGETARKRNPSTLSALTPMEQQVTSLVAQGLSNREVAEHCWISTRTVAFHLRNVFTKTGVTSRGELTRLHGADRAVVAT